MIEFVVKYNLLDDFEKQEVVDFIDFLLSKKSKEEEGLLAVINHTFSEVQQELFNELVAKRQSEIITKEELEELESLSGYNEQIAVERETALTKLSKLRDTTVRDLMVELKLAH